MPMREARIVWRDTADRSNKCVVPEKPISIAVLALFSFKILSFPKHFDTPLILVSCALQVRRLALIDEKGWTIQVVLSQGTPFFCGDIDWRKDLFSLLHPYSPNPGQE